ncbi:hypothetical protein PAL_GLEAN10009626 [Pteropus alecto]|uniref:Ion transport domain-containing protein n=1 Tax=Pteropus alecto TaxID=9402 RepID=L5L4L1_PTEAL|nr:hypothetical protein PAL_GLEAN10009626 [Pteropus alecto]
MSSAQPAAEGRASDVEILSQHVDEGRSFNPGPLVPFAYRDLPLAAADLSAAGSQLLSNLDEDCQEGSAWLQPCCGKRAAAWQVFLLSASVNSLLVACVVLVVTLLTLELLIDVKLLQFSSAFQFAGVIHWISLAILSVFFSETVLRIVVLGIWDYIENKIEVFDGAVIILSVAPMVASTVANGPRSPWDAISLIIMLRIWRVKRVIDAYVLPVKVEMEMAIQQYEKAKVIQDEQLERLTQICQEQGVRRDNSGSVHFCPGLRKLVVPNEFEIRQLRAHLAQQGLDLAAEREAALLAPQVRGRPHSRYHAVEETATEGLVEGLRPSPDSGAPEPAMCVVTTAAIDVHQPNVSSDLFSVDVPLKLGSSGTHVSTSESASHSARSSVTRAQSDSSQTLCSSADYSTTREEPSLEPSLSPLPPSPQQQVLLSSLSEDPCPSQKDSGPVPFGSPSRLCPQQSRMGAKGRSVPAGESGRLHSLSDGACHPLPVCCTHAVGEVHIFGIQRADTAPGP